VFAKFDSSINIKNGLMKTEYMGAGLYVALLATFALSGCLTMSGSYDVTVVDKEGNSLRSGSIMAHGSGIYPARNALCASYPGAIVHIKDAETGKELRSESPYRCWGR